VIHGFFRHCQADGGRQPGILLSPGFPGRDTGDRELALTENGHEAKLRRFKETGTLIVGKTSTQHDIKLSDFMVDVALGPNASLQDVFVFAMKAEDAACRMYERLAASIEGSDARGLFSTLAAQEKKHKFDLETEYEKTFMNEN